MIWLKPLVFSATAALSLTLGAGSANADKMYGPGASDTEIRIGNTNPYSGPASAYGTIGNAIAAYFKMVNDRGGVNGRKIDFVTLDDSYSPPKTVEQARKLVEQEKVLLVFQSLGTPTNTAIHKYMNVKKVPHLFVATGATKWGQPGKFPWTMGWQPNYQTEAMIYARYVLANVSDPKIGILYQNDDYGKDLVIGLKMGLGSKANLIVKETSYEVTDPTVDSQIVTLKNSGANVFLNVTTPKFAAQAIRKTYDIGWKPLHLINNVAASIQSVLKPAGIEKAEGLISSVYLKDPNDPVWNDDPGMKEWRAFMKRWYPKGNIANQFNLYGFSVAQTMEHVLKNAGDNLTRENIMKEAASIQNLVVSGTLPGITINTSASDFRPIEQMQLQRFDGTTWVRFGPLIEGRPGA